MTSYEKLMETGIEKFEREIFPLLLNNNLLKKNMESIPRFLPKVMDRLERQRVSVENKISLLRKHINNENNLDSFDKSVLEDLTFVLEQTMFGYFQIFKSYLVDGIDHPKIKMSDDDPKFGKMVKKLSEFKNPDGGLVFHYDGLRKFFNVDMYHILEHDLWWLNENLEFTFEEPDGTIIPINIGELQGELAGINVIVFAFTENYVKNTTGVNYDDVRRNYPQMFR